MASPEARAIVAELRDGGLSLSDIGRALERDSGLVSQIARDARGAGYGSSLVPALDALRSRLSVEPGRLMDAGRAKAATRMIAASGSIEVPRRRTKAGTVAAVRAGVKRAGPKGARVPGLYTKGTAGGNRGALATVMNAAQDSGQLVYINVTTSDGKRVGLGARTADEWEAYGLDWSGDFEWDDVIGELGDHGELDGTEINAVVGWSASMIAGA